MKLKIKQPLFFSQPSKQADNLDFIYPSAEEITTDTRLFIICDGYGPTRRGNDAAQVVGRCFHEYFTKVNPPKNKVGQLYINEALRYAERKLWQHIQENPVKQGIGSSIMLLYINPDDTISIAWVGNIRAYHVRDKQIVYETEDHLTVLRENGRNISVEPRIISGTEPVWASVTVITNIQTNDYFLLCSQGIYETFDQRNIKYLLSQGDGSDATNTSIAAKMQELCSQNWDDDFSFLLLQIREGTTIPESVIAAAKGLPPTDTSSKPLQLDNLPSGIIKRKEKKTATPADRKPLFSGGSSSANTPARAAVILLLIFVALSIAFAYNYLISKPEDVFNKYLAKAETHLQNKEYENAIELLQNALLVKLPDTSAFPEVRQKLAQAQISMLLMQAENLFNAQNWLKARAKYIELIALNPSDSVTAQQIEVLNQTINTEKTKLLAKADTLLNLKNYASAKQLFYEALYYDQTNEQILEQINLCNQFLNTGAVSLSDAVQIAMRMDSLGEFKANRLALLTATQSSELVVVDPADVYEQEPNPNNIYTSTLPTYKADETTQKMADLVKQADAAMLNSDFENAKTLYTEALNLKRTPELEAKINAAEQAVFNKKYKETVALADNAYDKGNYESAKNYYAEALKYKQNDEHAGARLDECAEKIQTSTKATQAKTEKYARLVEEANAAFAAEEYATAKAKYKEALLLSAADAATLNAKISSCDAKIADMQSDSSAKKLKRAEKLCKSENYGEPCFDHLKQNNLLYSIDLQILQQIVKTLETKAPSKAKECQNIISNR
ncbi:MAG TPA: PP2C family protein-serine/threonine phosphatase [Chitinophagales bacterium]|nr:PP2C family protein-serine/threonine phosphatase [Chitinophagales bacterium]HRK25728.1 PP2C family protein-serine/threonine phosphatase [Chitinophagales bacterium]